MGYKFSQLENYIPTPALTGSGSMGRRAIAKAMCQPLSLLSRIPGSVKGLTLLAVTVNK